MAKKALLVGTGLVALMGIAGALAAPPLIEDRINQAIDEALLQASSAEGVKISRESSRFDLWARTLEIDRLVYEASSGYPVRITVPKITAEGIDVWSLTMDQLSGRAAPANVMEALQRFSASRIHAPSIEAENRTLPEQVATTTYRDTVIVNFKNGVAETLSLAGATAEIPQDGEVVFEPIQFGAMRYEGIDLALHLALLMPDGPREEQTRVLFRSFVSEPMIMKGKTGDLPLSMEIGGATSDEMRVTPSLLRVNDIIQTGKAFQEAKLRGEAPSDEEQQKLLTTLIDAFLALELDRMSIDGIKMSIGNENVWMNIGPMTIAKMQDGGIGLIDIRNIDTAVAGKSFALARYRMENLDFAESVNLLRDKETLDSVAEDGLSTGRALRLLPRFEITMDGLKNVEDGAQLEIEQQTVALTGARGGLPTQFSFAMTGLTLPLPEDDARFDSLRSLGIETLRGKIGYGMSYDEATSSLKVDHLVADFDQLAAVEGKLTLGKIDMAKLDQSRDAFMENLAQATFVDAQLQVSDRNGGITRLMEKAAAEDGSDLQALKDELIVKAQVMGVLFLGGSAADVMPALLKFIEEPKAITVTARPKNADQPAAELYMSLSEGPQNLPNLLELEAVAE